MLEVYMYQKQWFPEIFNPCNAATASQTVSETATFTQTDSS